MSGTTLYLRTMLEQYEKQLLAARRLARYRRAARLANGEGEPTIDPEVKRKAMVERVARELYERVVFTGSDNPVVENIRSNLSRAVGGALRFTYPPGAERMRLVREGPEGNTPVPLPEQEQAMKKLWELTKAEVDKSML
ncbi:MAG: DVU0524 family FlgM-associated protein [Desulfovibrionaceae bacterium]